MSGTMTLAITFNILNCCACGGPIALTRNQEISLRETHKNFYCPMGHIQHFPQKSEAERLRDSVRNLEFDLQRARNEARNNEMARRVTKAKLTRLKNRIVNGVCPCCNHSFVNLQQHMTEQHPEFES